MSILNFKRKALGHTLQMGGGGSSGGGGGSQQQSNAYSSLSPWASPYITDMLGAAQAQVFSTTPTAGTPDVQTRIGTDDEGNPIYQTTPGTPAGNQITGMNPYNAFGSFNATGGQYGMNPSAMAAANSSVAQFSPLQNQSFQGAQGLQTPGQYGEATGAAGMGTMQGLSAGNRLAQQSTNPYAVGAYMNPYIQDALNPALQLSNQNFGMQGAAQQGAATQAGAFGGSRNALMQGLNQQNQMLANNQLIGNAYNNAFNNAQNQMNTVANVGLQGAQTGITGANALAGIGGQQLAAQQSNLGIQNQYGQQQTAQQQAVINQAMQNYQTGQQYPWTQLTNLKNLVSGIPVTDTTQTMQSAGPSGASQLAGLGTTAIGALGMANSGSTTNINVPKAAAEGGIMSIKRMASGGLGAINRQALLSPSSISKKQIETSVKDGAMAQPTGALAAAMQAQEQKQAQQAPQAPTSTVIQDIMGQQQQQAQEQDVMAKLPMIMADLKVKMDIALEKGDKEKAQHYAMQLQELSALAQQAQAGQPQEPQSAPAPQGIDAALAQPPQDPNAPAPQQPSQGIAQASGGGMIAFNKGGQVRRYAEGGASDIPLVSPELTSWIPAGVKDWASGIGDKFSNAMSNVGNAQEVKERLQAMKKEDAPVPDSLGRTSANMEDAPVKRDYSGIIIGGNSKASGSAVPAAPKEIASITAFDTTKQTNDVTSMINNWSNMLMGQYNQDNSGKNFWKGVMGAGAEMAAGTSPYGRANVGAGIKSGFNTWSQAEVQDSERKDKMLQQMMSLGLSGAQLKMEAAKLGIAQEELKAKLPLLSAQAKYYGAKAAGGSGVGSRVGAVPAKDALALKDKYTALALNPKADPTFYAALPKNVKDLLKASEGTKSYESGMAEVRKIAGQQFRDDIRYVKEMGAKSPDSIITSSE